VVDVVIPVYGAAKELEQCLASVEAHSDLATHHVIVVADGPQDEDVERALARFPFVRILRNDRRLGFAATANRGMASSTNDVILLNSDAVVTPRWIEKLLEAAASDARIGTVTPLSNNATLCSVPRSFEENLLPSGFDATSFGELVERVSAREYPRIPTAVGFCMFIRRALLDEIGPFDAQRFAGGYGEENDFCMRASARGWLHVADDATFVYHAGSRSFGRERRARQRTARRALSRAHPRYDAIIADFMKRDPLAPVRSRIAQALSPARDGGLRVVHVVHGWPPFQQAGAELYAWWLASRQRERHTVAVYARSAEPREERSAVELNDRGVRVRLMTNRFTARDPLRRNAIRDGVLDRDFARFLADEKPDLVHIHHLAGHAFSLASVPRRLGIPVVMQVQDWWSLCARVNLLDRDGNRCSGPSPAKCAACATLTHVPLANRLLHAMRRRAARRALRCADVFIAGSESIRDDYAAIVPRKTPFHVIPYGIALAPNREPRPPAQRPIRFGYVGSIGAHKGVHVAVEAMRGVTDATLHVFGDAAASPPYVASMNAPANVVFEGRFAEKDKARVFAAMDVLLVPSIGLESFGLAAREAMESGVPVIASAGGALSEMFEPDTCGDFFPTGDTDALRAILRRIVDDPLIIDRWRSRLPYPKSADAHAEEIEAVYRNAAVPAAGAAASRRRGPAIVRVIQGEGIKSAMTRAAERFAEHFERRAYVPRRGVALLNAGSIARRNGGVQVQLAARLAEERALRPIALVEDGDFERALSTTGARALQIDGTSGVDCDALLRLIARGVDVILSLHDFTMTNRELLQSARAVIFPSQFLRDAYREFVMRDAVVIEPSGPLSNIVTEGRGVAFAGAVKRHKGAHLLPDLAARGIALHVFGGGDVDLLRALRRQRNVVVHGYYRAGTLASLLARHRIGLVLLPSIVPEAFSLTLSETWRAGSLAAAFDLGAQGERLRHGGGWLAPLDSGAAGLASIAERFLAGESVPRVSVTATPQSAAREHVALYRRLGILQS